MPNKPKKEEKTCQCGKFGCASSSNIEEQIVEEFENSEACYHKELMNLLNNPITGLKDSSNTNKTRYSIIALFEEKIYEQMQAALHSRSLLLQERLETLKLIQSSNRLEYNSAIESAQKLIAEIMEP